MRKNRCAMPSTFFSKKITTFFSWCFFSFALVNVPANASELRSELHLGVGLGGQYLPHYRGSNETHTTVLPIPVIEYRGRILKSDGDGTRVEFSLAERVEFNISADLALRESNEETPLREGMPELKSEFQFGPSINIDLTGQGFNRGLILRLPLRPAISVGDGVEYIGFIANPMLTWIKPNIVDGWRLSFDAGLLYGSSDYHHHYYSVAPQYVTATRPEYAANDGFSGTFTELGIGSRRGNLIYGFNLRYDNLRHASFHSSPLVETDDYWSFTFGVGWFFKSWYWSDDV